MYTAQKFLSNIKTYTSCLGQGAFGIVLKGIDETDTPSAFKFLFPIDYPDRDKLRREYKVSQGLRHENIVQVMDVEEKNITSAEIESIFKDLMDLNDRSSYLKAAYIERAKRYETIKSICIKMELCGSNLRSWLNEKHDPDELSIQIRQTRIVQGTITGLDYLHNKKIIHRDLKPENIMFSRGRYQLPVKIGDFGHSRVIHTEESQTGSLTRDVGTWSYMAPEVSDAKYDQQADLYSLGLIIWEVAQLIEPSRRRNLFDKLVNERKTTLVQDHPIMAGIKEIIIGFTKREPKNRPSLIALDMKTWDQAIVYKITELGSKPLWDSINSNSDKNWTVKTSHEFKLALDNAREGCKIHLIDGEFPEGGFILWENGVEIIGQGSGTVLPFGHGDEVDVLIVFGNECTISGLKIIYNLILTTLSVGIILIGSKNTIKSVGITSSLKPDAMVDARDINGGIKVIGSHNTVDNVVRLLLEYRQHHIKFDLLRLLQNRKWIHNL